MTERTEEKDDLKKGWGTQRKWNLRKYVPETKAFLFFFVLVFILTERDSLETQLFVNIFLCCAYLTIKICQPFDVLYDYIRIAQGKQELFFFFFVVWFYFIGENKYNLIRTLIKKTNYIQSLNYFFSFFFLSSEGKENKKKGREAPLISLIFC